MTVSEKIKTIDNKMEQNKTQYDLDRQTANNSALSSGNVSKYAFLTDKDVYPKNQQTSVAEKQYEKLENVFECNKKEENETKNKRIRVNSNRVCNNYFTLTNIATLKNLLKVHLIEKEMI